MKFAEVLLEKVDKKDFVAGVVGQNIVLEGMAFSVFEMMYAMNEEMNPKFAHTLSGTIADERRHVGFGENRIGSLIKEHPEKQARDRADAEGDVLLHARDLRRRLPQQPGGGGARALGRRARRRATTRAGRAPTSARMAPEEMEAVLADTVLKEFKTRLGRIGLEYQTPACRPEMADRPRRSSLDLPTRTTSSRRCTPSSSGSRRSRATSPERPGGHRPDAVEAPLGGGRARSPDHGPLQLLRRRDRRARGRERPHRHRAEPPRQGVPLDAGRRRGPPPRGLLHRLRDLGVADPSARSSAAPAAACSLFRRRLLELVASKDWEAAIFAQNVILESLEFAVFQSHARTADPVTAEVLRGRRQGRAPPHRLRRERARPAARRPRRTSAPASAGAGRARPPGARRARGDHEDLGWPRDSARALGRAYLESVERLGFAS